MPGPMAETLRVDTSSFPCLIRSDSYWCSVLSFDLYGRNQIGRDFPILPSGISPHAEQGEVVVWEGKSLLFWRDNDSCEEMHLAPAELIDVDCPVRIPLSRSWDAAEEYSREQWLRREVGCRGSTLRS